MSLPSARTQETEQQSLNCGTKFLQHSHKTVLKPTAPWSIRMTEAKLCHSHSLGHFLGQIFISWAAVLFPWAGWNPLEQRLQDTTGRNIFGDILLCWFLIRTPCKQPCSFQSTVPRVSKRNESTQGGKRESWELSGPIWDSFHGLEVSSIVRCAKHGVAITGANCSD